MGKYVKQGKLVDPGQLAEVVKKVKDKDISLRRGAATLGVSVFFLNQRVKGLVPVEGFIDKRGLKTVLSLDVEMNLASLLKIMAKWGHGLTRHEVFRTVRDYCNLNNIATPFKDGLPGQAWWSSFCKRTTLTLKFVEQLQGNRLKNTSDPFLIYEFYDILEALAKELKLDHPGAAAHFWNLDECPNNHDPNKVKMVTGKDQTHVFRSIQGSGRESTTVMACVSADGTLLPPLIIFKAMRLWDQWRGNADLPGTFYACAENGYITSDIFFDFFQKFCQKIKLRPLIMIFDGHVSHLDIRSITLAIKEGVALVKVPSHTTDVLQPLDKTCFGPYKKKLNQTLISWQRENQRSLSKAEFVDLVCSIWNEGIPPLTRGT